MATAASTDEGETRQLGRHIASSSFSQLPPPVVHEALRALVNIMGCAIGGAAHPSMDILLRSLLPFAGAPQAAIAGRRERSDCLLAALAMGTASHVQDFDDTHPDILLHPSGQVIAALLPLAEMRKATGEELLNAFVVGVEVECRVARAVLPSHYDQGWHTTGTAGIFGAAAACARLLRLDAQGCTWALGIASTQSAAIREMFGSMCKSLHVGRAAQGGLMAALMAQGGFTSSDTALEGKRGFINVLSTTPHAQALVAGLGTQWELLRNTYKPFACGLVIHPVLDGCIQLRERHGLTADDVEKIELSVHPLALELTGKPRPATGLEGKFSIFHSAAVAIIDGAGGEAQYGDARVRDAAVIALRDRVQARVDTGLGIEQAVVAITTRGGARHEVRIEHCVGSLERPLDDAGLDAKFLALAQPQLGDRAGAALAALRGAASCADAGAIARACALG